MQLCPAFRGGVLTLMCGPCPRGRQFGALKTAAVAAKPDGSSKGFAMVTYRRKVPHATPRPRPRLCHSM